MFKHLIKIPLLLLVVFVNAYPVMSAQQKILEKITFEAPSPEVDEITFKLNGPYIPTIFAIKGERPRVVFDFPNTKPARLIKNTVNTNGKFVQRIRMGIHYAPKAKTRIVFDLLQDKKIDFKQHFDKQSNLLIISVFQAGQEPAAPAKPITLQTQAKKAPVKSVPPANNQTAGKPETSKKPAPAKAISEHKKQPLPEKHAVQQPVEKKPVPVVPVKRAEVKSIKPHTAPSAQPKQKGPVVKKEQRPTAKKNKPGKKPASITQKKKTVVPASAQQKKPLVADHPILKSVTFNKKDNRGEMVLFRLNTFQAPIVFGVEEGQPRVVCDFKNTEGGKDLPKSIKVNGKYIREVRIEKEEKAKKIRAILELTPNMSFDLQQVFFKKENLFVIIINVQK